MPKEDLGSRRAQLRPPKKEETKGKWKRRMIQFIAVVIMILMAFSGLIVFFAGH